MLPDSVKDRLSAEMSYRNDKVDDEVYNRTSISSNPLLKSPVGMSRSFQVNSDRPNGHSVTREKNRDS